MYIHDVYPKKGGAMETTVFLSNRSQAVRLPKAVALPEDVKKVEIIAIGRTRIITPADGLRRVQRLFQIAGFQNALLLHTMPPDTGKTVGLEFHTHR
jgi:virulence-associated protein VagC